MSQTNKATEIADKIDACGGECYKCRGTRHEYRCYGRVARRRCLAPGCKVVIALDVTAGMQRDSKGWGLDQWRSWWQRVYG